MKTKSIGFIGGGRITKILLQAFQNKGVDLSSTIVFDINSDVLSGLKGQFPYIQTVQSADQPAQCEIIFIALHPPVIMESLSKISSMISENTMVISLAPKISFDKIASQVKTPNIARMIPNATSYINQGYNPITFANKFNSAHKQELLKLFELLGSTFEVDEPKLEAYAILSAMLPTYFWFQWRELIKLGDAMGLSKKESEESLHQSLVAAINTYFNSGLAPEEVIDLIPVKPIGEHEENIGEVYRNKLLALFEKIKP
jgi:pyrroline-5-carboxylate reductase